MSTPNLTCPRAHLSCGSEHDGHHCWKNPGHTGPHGCICWFIFTNQEGNTDD